MEGNKDTIKLGLNVIGALLLFGGTLAGVSAITNDLHANNPDWHNPKDIELLWLGGGLLTGGVIILGGTILYDDSNNVL